MYEDMSIDQRRNHILELISHSGKVKVAELSDIFAISEVTIRGDLDALARQGLLERVHGGAVSTYRSYHNMDFMGRAKTNETEKKLIAEAVAKLVSMGDTLMINAGTTTLYVMNCLKDIKNLSIITNSIALALEADRYKNISVTLLGGQVNTQYQFTYGDDAVTQLSRYRVDKLILAVDGVSCEEGISTCFQSESEVDRRMIERANQVIIATDYTKIGRVSFANIAAMDRADYLVTNDNASGAELDEIASRGVQVITV